MPEKHEVFVGCARLVLAQEAPSIHAVATVIGKMVANLTAVEYGELFYRQVELEKATALKVHSGDFEAHMILSEAARADILWWIDYALQ